MQQKIIKLARKEFKLLLKKYPYFCNVLVDDWRGFRFIFDTKDVRVCKNNCLKCSLFLLVGEKNNKIFSSGLYKASKEDKKIFGHHNYLNCKTLEQYRNCYLNFIFKKTRTKQEIVDELKLIKNLCFVYSSRRDNLFEKELKFKKDIFRELVLKTKDEKKKIIKEFYSLHF